jgi:hypothetical protein
MPPRKWVATSLRSGIFPSAPTATIANAAIGSPGWWLSTDVDGGVVPVPHAFNQPAADGVTAVRFAATAATIAVDRSRGSPI